MTPPSLFQFINKLTDLPLANPCAVIAERGKDNMIRISSRKEVVG